MGEIAVADLQEAYMASLINTPPEDLKKGHRIEDVGDATPLYDQIGRDQAVVQSRHRQPLINGIRNAKIKSRFVLRVPVVFVHSRQIQFHRDDFSVRSTGGCAGGPLRRGGHERARSA
jgi:hypothetical protein